MPLLIAHNAEFSAVLHSTVWAPIRLLGTQIETRLTTLMHAPQRIADVHPTCMNTLTKNSFLEVSSELEIADKRVFHEQQQWGRSLR